MNASSGHLCIIAAAGMIYLTTAAIAQPPPDQGLSKKEIKQMKQQDRHDSQGQGQPGGNNIPQGVGRGVPTGPIGQPQHFVPPNSQFNIQDNSANAIKNGRNLKDEPKSTPVSQKFKNQPDMSQFELNQDGGKHGSQGQGKGNGQIKIEGLPANTGPVSTPHGGSIQIQDSGDLSKKQLHKQQQQEQIDVQGGGNNKGKKGHQGENISENPPANVNATPFVPSGTPPGGGRLKGLSKNEQNKLDNQEKQQQHQQEQQAKKDQNQFEKLQKHGEVTPAAGEPTPAGEVDAGKGKGRLDKLNKGKLNPNATPAADQALNAQGTPAAPLSKHEMKLQVKDAKQAQQEANQAAKQLVQLQKKQDKIELKNLSGAEKAVLVGADTSQLHIDAAKKLSKNDAITVIGNNNTIIKNKTVYNKTVVNNINLGVFPAGYGLPWGSYGYVHHPLIGFDIGCSYCLPAVPAIGIGFGALNWNYWDGRCHYDHSYCDSIFLGIGHVRYDGCDGAIVGGRYFCYGWGWIDGCIDYGERRIWCPGFWAPYTVEECGNVPVWVPPSYEDVWTGCCWETVQVDGGYFAPSPSLDCHYVTRYTWMPGHFEYAYA